MPSEIVAANIDVAAMVTAALGQSQGNQKAHYINALITALGTNPRLVLKRNGSTVYSDTFNATLAASGGSLALPASLAGSPAVNSAADIDTGTWLMQVQKASDATKYLEMTLGPNGGDTVAALSMDLDGTAQINPTIMLLAAPQTLDASVTTGGIPNLTVNTIIDDMGLPNDDAAFGFSNWWSRNPPSGITNGFVAWGTNWDSSVQAQWFLDQENIGSALQTRYWRFFHPWMVPYIGDGHGGSNHSLKFCLMRLLARRRDNGQWVVLRKDNTGSGAGFFKANLGNAIASGGDVQSRQLADCKEMELTNIFSLPANQRYVHHGVWSTRQYMLETDYDLIVHAMVASMGLWTTGGTDNRGDSSCVLAMGGDPYPSTTFNASQSGNLPSFAHSRLKRITSTPQWHTCATLLNCFQDHQGPTAAATVASLINNPPPASMLIGAAI